MKRKRILVIEDDGSIRKAVVDALSIYGYEVSHTFRAEEAYELITYHDFDLVLLDLVLPGADGRTLLQRVRKEGMEVPVIIMTACGIESERVHGLQSGADDYVVKPFSLRELIARVEAVLRRSRSRNSPQDFQTSTLHYAHGTIELENRRICLVDGSVESLTQRESELLAYMAGRSKQTISREDILQHVWKLKPEGINTRTIDMHIARLREKLRDKSEPPTILMTVRGKGYRLQTESSHPNLGAP